MKKALLVVILGAIVASAGSAFAGVSFSGAANNTPIIIAKETFTSLGVFKLPSGPPVPEPGTISRILSVVPQASGAYTIEANLGTTITPADPTQSGVTWVANPAFSDVTIASSGGGGCGAFSAVLVIASATQYRWNTSWAGGCTSFPTITIAFNNVGGFVDVNDGRGPGNGLDVSIPIKAQVRFLDQATLTEFPSDQGNTIFTWIQSLQAAAATVVSATSPTSATIDVATQKKNFLAINGDTIVVDNGATVTTSFNGSYFDWPAARGCTFDPNTGCIGGTLGFFSFVMTPVGRDFSGFVAGSPTIDGFSTTGTLTSRGYSYSNLFSSITSGTPEPLISQIDGVTTQNTGSFGVTVTYSNGICAGGSCPGTLKDTLLAGATYTTWGLNGTILYAPFLNGNTGSFTQRFYICAPLSSVAAPTFDVIINTVPVVGASSVVLAAFTMANTLTPATTTVGGTGACMNIRWEDLAATAGITLPYVTDGGNLSVQMTFPAPNVIGIHQTTNLGVSPTSFVTAPMIRLNRNVHINAFGIGAAPIDPGP